MMCFEMPPWSCMLDSLLVHAPTLSATALCAVLLPSKEMLKSFSTSKSITPALPRTQKRDLLPTSTGATPRKSKVSFMMRCGLRVRSSVSMMRSCSRGKMRIHRSSCSAYMAPLDTADGGTSIISEHCITGVNAFVTALRCTSGGARPSSSLRYLRVSSAAFFIKQEPNVELSDVVIGESTEELALESAEPLAREPSADALGHSRKWKPSRAAPPIPSRLAHCCI
mmetsp:Transcript_6911/g.16054  ORF Transcript_6911/g.16054 Transcript_6911/m.16054 type:complete len:225 (-) Transcript_6911:1512-2186(-)